MVQKLYKLSHTEHQELLYEIVYTLDDYCKQHNIRYFLAYGSLIGAVRHGGIIPWDDDVDVWMEREEYNRFQKLVYDHPIPGYTANSMLYTKGYFYPFIKFSKDGTRITEPFAYVPPIGINIDVFPIDGCPSADFTIAREYAINKRNEIWWQLHHWTGMKLNQSKGIVGKMVCLKYSFPRFKKQKLQEHYESCGLYGIKGCRYFANLTWTFYEGLDVHLKETISSVVYLPFGTCLLPCPVGYHEILSAIYGDYMTPPAEDKRNTTHQHDGAYILLG